MFKRLIRKSFLFVLVSLTKQNAPFARSILLNVKMGLVGLVDVRDVETVESQEIHGALYVPSE